MKVQFSLVGVIPTDEMPQSFEIQLDSIPRVDDSIQWPLGPELYVRHVGWYLTHDEEWVELVEPFVYVVVGPRNSD